MTRRPAAGAAREAEQQIWTSNEADRRSLPRGRHKLSKIEVANSQRARILNAALTTAAQKGIAHAVVADVTSLAHLSRKTFYELYDDFDDCFRAAFTAASDALLVEIVAASLTLPPSRDFASLRAGLLRNFELVSSAPLLTQACLIEAPAGGPAALELVGQQRQRSAAMIGAGYAACVGRAPSRSAKAKRHNMAAIGVVIETTIESIANGTTAKLPGRTDDVLAMMIAALEASER